jgi:AraC-like DNA-binding protein
MVGYAREPCRMSQPIDQTFHRVVTLPSDGVRLPERPENRFETTDRSEEVSIGMVLSSANGTDQSNSELSGGQGDLYVVDVGRPVASLVIDHHELAIFLPRQSVAEAIGGDASRLCGRRLPARGIGVLLAAHMRAIAAESTRLSSSELALATRTAGDLALATMQDAVGREADVDRSARGPYLAACSAIDEHCTDPSFSPARLATIVGASRAKLYRLFAAQGTSIATAIWQARLKRAHYMVSLPIHRDVPLGELAYRCGFLDHSTFSRMFKQRYGVTPRDLREGRIAHAGRVNRYSHA